MEKSILTTVKKLLGIQKDYTHFDDEIITQINAAFSTANQLGVGPGDGFRIHDDTAVWEDVLGERTDLEFVKTYIWLKVRLAFDPPQMGYLVDSIKKQIEEMEFRMNTQVEFGDSRPTESRGERVIKFTIHFTANDWILITDLYRIIVPVSKHNVHVNPIVASILKDGATDVIATWKAHPNGDIELRANERFSGSAVIL